MDMEVGGQVQSSGRRPQNGVEMLADNVLLLGHLTCGVFELGESCLKMVSHNYGRFMTVFTDFLECFRS
jgi:hypothetical protein